MGVAVLSNKIVKDIFQHRRQLHNCYDSGKPACCLAAFRKLSLAPVTGEAIIRQG